MDRHAHSHKTTILCFEYVISSLSKHSSLCSLTFEPKGFTLYKNSRFESFGFENDNILNNHVEIDETYIGGKNKNRHFDKKVENSQGRSTKDKVPVLGMIERQGKVNAKAVENVTADTLTREIIKCVRDSANIYTDEYLGYNRISQFYIHAVVRHNLSQYVDGAAFTNNIEGFWFLVKRGLIGIYHFTSKKHLQKYLDEFVFRFNTKDFSEVGRFNRLLTNMTVRTRYQDLIAA